MRTSRAVACALACLAGTGLAGTGWGSDRAGDERRVDVSDLVLIWCDDGNRTSHQFLELEEHAQLRLPRGKHVRVGGLAATEILERWRGSLCREEDGMARAVALVRPGDDLGRLVQRYPIVDRTLERSFEEIERFLSRRLAEQIQGRPDTSGVSNGSLILLPSPDAADPNR